MSIIVNLGMLFYFKHFNFMVGAVAGFLGLNWSVTQITLPIGISFYTFQGMSYVIDVYRDKDAEKGQELVQKTLLSLPHTYLCFRS